MNSNERIVRRYINEVWNEGKLEVIDEIVAADFMGYGPGPGQFHGREGLKYFTGSMSTVGEMTGEKWDYRIDDLIVQDGRAAVRMTDQTNLASYPWHASPEKKQQREKETGMSWTEEMHNEVIAIFHIQDGKIRRQWMESNAPNMAQTGAR